MTQYEAKKIKIGDLIKINFLITKVTGIDRNHANGEIMFETKYGNFAASICSIALTNK